MSKLVTAKTLAERAGVAPRTIREAAQRGRIKCIRISRRSIRFREDALDELETASPSTSSPVEQGEG